MKLTKLFITPVGQAVENRNRIAIWSTILVSAIVLALIWLVTANSMWFRPSVSLGPTDAPYYKPAPFTELAPGLKRFQIYATDGLHHLPGGGSLYVWGYSTENRPGSALFPGPTIVVNEGDQVEIVFTNLGMAHPDVLSTNHSIHLHGLDVPEWTDGVLTTVNPDESFTYAFKATHPGTYWYHCHVDTIAHLTMGMYGAVVVRARDGLANAWNDGPSYDKEYTLVLSEADPVVHAVTEQSASYDRTRYDPRYFFINGQSFPNVMDHPPNVIRGRKGESALVRLVNAGYTWKSMHMHGFHFEVIASDGRPLPQALRKDTLSIGPGERYDILVKFDQTGSYPFHSHAIVDNLNNGRYPGGIHTMVQVAQDDASSSTHHHDAQVGQISTDLSLISYLKIGEVRAHARGVPWLLPSRPIELEGAILAPAGFVAQALGAEFTLERDSTDATFLRSGKSIKVPIVAQSYLVPAKVLADFFGVPVFANPGTGELLIAAASIEPLSASRQLVRMPTLPLPVISAVSSPEQGLAQASVEVIAGTKTEPVVDSSGSATSTKLVVIHARSFDPPELRIPTNTRVLWSNQESISHAVSDMGSTFSSGDFVAGARWSFVFTDPGVYNYFCTIHPEMIGRIVVTQ